MRAGKQRFEKQPYPSTRMQAQCGHLFVNMGYTKGTFRIFDVFLFEISKESHERCVISNDQELALCS